MHGKFRAIFKVVLLDAGLIGNVERFVNLDSKVCVASGTACRILASLSKCMWFMLPRALPRALSLCYFMKV